VPTGHVTVGTGGSHVTVSRSVGTSPGGHVNVVGGAHGVAPHGPSAGGGVGTTDAGGAGGAAGGAGAGAAAGGGGADGAGAAGAGVTVGGAGGAGIGCSRAGSSDVGVELPVRCTRLNTLSVPSGDVGMPEQPAASTEMPTNTVLRRITSTSLPNSEG